jgi:ATP-dependent helicase/nuclease subunit B
MARESPNVFTIPASAPFLRTLIRALLDGKLVNGSALSDDPLALANVTLYLPTQRACRLARDTFLDVLGKDAALLPRLVPIGGIDEDEIVLAEAAAGPLAAHALACPEAVGAIERTLLLAELIRAWAEQPRVRTEREVRLVASNPASIFALAGDLGRLMDDFITRDADWNKLDGLVPADLDQYWQLTLEFLGIARDAWPKTLAGRGKIESAERQKLLIAAETNRLARAAAGPVIAAGSTGSTPATANLLATIARLPHGAVVLPGLDTDLDTPSWEQIGSDDKDAPHAYGHPQFALHGLLRQIGITRDAVTILGTRGEHGREQLLSEALRPAGATEHWESHLRDKTFDARAAAAMSGISVIAAAHAEDEALGIAVALRETVDDGTPESRSRTAALITPDRALARRVIAALARWNVPVDDSGGDGLGATPAGTFARLAAQVALGGGEPVPLLALLKHPLLRLGAHAFAHKRAIETLEFAVLRGPRPGPGTAGLKQALSAFARERDSLHHSDPRNAIAPEQLASAETLVEKLAAALAPLEQSPPSPRPFAELVAQHRDVIAALSKDSNGDSAAFAPRAADTEKLLAFFSEVEQADCDNRFPLKPSDYAEAFQTAIASRQVRRPGAPNARVRILGPLEARLLQADRVVLGGLVEGVWPPDPQTDPWLSRPMRRQLGLDLPERRIGLTAHDFAQALGAENVVLSYAAKRDGAPTVMSRFLQRLAAVAGQERWKQAVDRGNAYLDWGRSLDEPDGEARPCERPAPRPPREARPTALTVTEIEHWLRDPYTIYARHVLGLRALDVIDASPGAADRGTFIHEAIGNFSRHHAAGLPADPLNELLAFGRRAFAAVEAYPDARAFWWPRFERIARWFIAWETQRRANVSAVITEMRAAHEFPVGERTFRLIARADRIEQLSDGRYAVLDFKTGQPPGDREVAAGLAPQLTLEAAILRRGGFKGIPADVSLAELVYVRLSGGEPAGKDKAINFSKSTPNEKADEALTNLKKVAEEFEKPETAYLSFARPKWVGRTYSDYDHLARVKEWSATGGQIEDAGE